MPTQTLRMRFSQNTQRINKMVSSAVKTGKHLVHLAQTSPVPRAFCKSYLAFLAFVIGLSICLFFLVSVRIDGYKLGYRVMELEREKARLDETMQELKAQQAHRQSHSYLLRMNKSLGLYMEPPQEWLWQKK